MPPLLFFPFQFQAQALYWATIFACSSKAGPGAKPICERFLKKKPFHQMSVQELLLVPAELLAELELEAREEFDQALIAQFDHHTISQLQHIVANASSVLSARANVALCEVLAGKIEDQADVDDGFSQVFYSYAAA